MSTHERQSGASKRSFPTSEYEYNGMSLLLNKRERVTLEAMKKGVSLADHKELMRDEGEANIPIDVLYRRASTTRFSLQGKLKATGSGEFIKSVPIPSTEIQRTYMYILDRKKPINDHDIAMKALRPRPTTALRGFQAVPAPVAPPDLDEERRIQAALDQAAPTDRIVASSIRGISRDQAMSPNEWIDKIKSQVPGIRATADELVNIARHVGVTVRTMEVKDPKGNTEKRYYSA